ncbi:uncharacterized protein N7482_002755 [Penicillium canariense]|uniref:Uncharacterized protein n=1 Tax=Penicillium canariense TaxID=189055 RepID=A0A9W9IHL5_9EURO|nr:uncharacterized protein N7482_002755 [Penicillium canariense]KAJ5176878.1 hypothetical protein N7482_002755 [Penicillium canariense]
MVAATLAVLAAMTLTTCQYLHIAACYAKWATTLTAAMVYFGYSFYDIIKRDALRNANEMQQLTNTVSLGNNDVDAAVRRLEHERTTQAYDRWKQEAPVLWLRCHS